MQAGFFSSDGITVLNAKWIEDITSTTVTVLKGGKDGYCDLVDTVSEGTFIIASHNKGSGNDKDACSVLCVTGNKTDGYSVGVDHGSVVSSGGSSGNAHIKIDKNQSGTYTIPTTSVFRIRKTGTKYYIINQETGMYLALTDDGALTVLDPSSTSLSSNAAWNLTATSMSMQIGSKNYSVQFIGSGTTLVKPTVKKDNSGKIYIYGTAYKADEMIY